MNTVSKYSIATVSNDELIDLMARRQMELTSLLEITRAVNNNHSPEDLYRMVSVVLQKQMGINKALIYTRSSLGGAAWKPMLMFGFNSLPDSDKIHSLFEQAPLSEDYQFIRHLHKDFSLLIPIRYGDMLCCLLLEGLDTQNEDQMQIDINLIKTAINIVLVAAENRRLQAERLREERFKAEMRLAAQLQTGILPHFPPNHPNIDVAFKYKPYHRLSGDYYDFGEGKTNPFIYCIADVSGKGASSALLVAGLQAALRIALPFTKSLTETIKIINNYIYERTNGDKHITLFLAAYDFDTQILTYINAGHPPSILIDECGHTFLKEGCTVIGAFKELPFLNVGEVKLTEGSLIFNYTDGLTELDLPNGNVFAEDDILKILFDYRNLSSKEINQIIMQKVDDRLCGNRATDDITMLTLKIN